MISVYKPAKNGNGCAANFYISKHDSVGLNVIQQHSWNGETRSGSFKENINHPEKSASVKLNISECGEIINAILRRTEWSAFHTFNKNVTKIRFTIWEGKGFGLTVDKNGNLFKLPITYGEAEAIKILMEEFIRSQCKQKPKPNPQ